MAFSSTPRRKEVLAGDMATLGLSRLASVQGHVRSDDSEYHFVLRTGKSPSLSVFCEDSAKNGSDEYLSVEKRIRDAFALPRRPMFVPSQEDISDALQSIYDDFSVPEEERVVILDYLS